MIVFTLVLYFSLFFGPSTVHCDQDPVINRSTGATLDDLVADLVRSIDYNGDGILDIDEVRKGLIGQFAGPGKYKPNQHAISGNYKPVFIYAYWEHSHIPARIHIAGSGSLKANYRQRGCRF